MLDDPREGTHHDAAPARNVEHGVLRSRPGGLHDEAERLLVLDAGRRRERDSLTAELVEDQITVARA
jgi:hypothetical protein